MPPRKKTGKTPEEVARAAILPPALGAPVHEGEQADFGLGHEIAVVFPLVEVAPPAWHLPPFSGKKTRCSKCGIGALSEDSIVGTTYHAHVPIHEPCYRLYVQGNMPLYTQIGFPEHLDRRCPVCHYEWVEALADGPLDD